MLGVDQVFESKSRAFALSPKILLLDEPFGMLDSLTRYELQKALIDLWSETDDDGLRKTALMVTHDVDEALFLSDCIAMMTTGPYAHLGGIIEVPFERPRDRRAVMEDPRYHELREQLIGFLTAQERRHSDPLPKIGKDAGATESAHSENKALGVAV